MVQIHNSTNNFAYANWGCFNVGKYVDSSLNPIRRAHLRYMQREGELVYLIFKRRFNHEHKEKKPTNATHNMLRKEDDINSSYYDPSSLLIHHPKHGPSMSTMLNLPTIQQGELGTRRGVLRATYTE